jgi:hypothetical protein
MSDSFSQKEVRNFIERIIELEKRLARLKDAARLAEDSCGHAASLIESSIRTPTVKLYPGDVANLRNAMNVLHAALEDSDE